MAADRGHCRPGPLTVWAGRRQIGSPAIPRQALPEEFRLCSNWVCLEPRIPTTIAAAAGNVSATRKSRAQRLISDTRSRRVVGRARRARRRLPISTHCPWIPYSCSPKDRSDDVVFRDVPPFDPDQKLNSSCSVVPPCNPHVHSTERQASAPVALPASSDGVSTGPVKNEAHEMLPLRGSGLARHSAP